MEKASSKAIESLGTNEGPIPKRQKLTNGTSSHLWARQQSSRIFTPYRSIGLVSPTTIPFTSIPLGKTTFQITTSAGRCLQTYDLRKGLNLTFLTRPQTPEIITATASWKSQVFASWGGETQHASRGIWVFQRGKLVDELETKDILDEPVQRLLIFGSWIVGCCSTKIQVWRSSNYEHYTTLTPMRSSTSKKGNTLSGAICTMPTYLNKILAGRADGNIEIWNLSTGKLIYTLLPPTSDIGPVSALAPTPALSLLTISYQNGPIIIRDVKADKILLRLDSGSSYESPITSISFRTDGLGAGEDGRKAGIMATSALGSGDVTFWDLNHGGRIVGKLRGAHDPPSFGSETIRGGVNKVEYLAGQPVLVTTGLDNSLKTWIFDETPFSPLPRILHGRGGHAAPITRLEFLPSDADGADAGGKWLLSAGRDRSLWGWSLRRDGQSTELSQGKIRKKAKQIGMFGNNNGLAEMGPRLEELKTPEITCVAMSLNRDGGIGASAGEASIWSNNRGNKGKKGTFDASSRSTTGWESVVTGHQGDRFARTWFWGRKRAGRWTFETGDKGVVKSVAMTPCGTFAIVGSDGGSIDTFNLQSGIHRQKFPARLTPVQAKKLQLEELERYGTGFNTKLGMTKSLPGHGRHTKAVTGLAVDSTNRILISCSMDGFVKFWNFTNGTHMDEIGFIPPTAISGLRYYHSSDLVALSCSDLSIKVIDVETKRIVRELRGMSGQINDFCFSNDGRWIIAASGDSMLRVWDLPTGHLIDAIRLKSPCSALAFSNTGEFLATAQGDSVGVNIWNNRALFTHVPTRQISDSEITDLTASNVSGDEENGLLQDAFDEEVKLQGIAGDMESTTLEQLSKEIMTLSLVPRDRWQRLLHLDVIKQRNKPKEPPKAPENAPFFLPSLDNSKPGGGLVNFDEQTRMPEKSRVLKTDRLAAESDFTTLLLKGSERADYNPFIDHLKSLPPATADLEIRSLNSVGSSSELKHFVAALASRLRQKLDYELVQTWMTLFLRIHGEVIEGNEGLIAALREWRSEQEAEAQRLGSLTGYCAGVVNFLRSSRA
ncbi:MAG: hypothetical protein M1837_004685 [Sclerophora amabilis]|nr:MAG: hypothetical protein M1837_004685 [Sclerophora amabilis]